MYELLPVIAVLLVISILLGIITTIIAWKKKKEGTYEEPDYRAFYVLGICFLPMGFILMVVVDNPGFVGISGLGAVYMAISLANRDKWKET